MPDFEIIVIGAGVVGLAIGARLSERHPHIVVLEKNAHYGMETSSRNSEVIHAGIYYPHGSLKAQLCVEGNALLYELSSRYSIPHRRITKIISASTKEELGSLDALYRHGLRNGVSLQMMTREEVLEREPNINSAGGIFSPATGIISAHRLMDCHRQLIKDHGGDLQERCEVTAVTRRPVGAFDISIREGSSVNTISSEIVINAAGLFSDAVAAMAGIDIDTAKYRLSYAKGSYFSIVPAKRNLIRHLVYPAPDNESLGVHALLDLEGRLKFGPDVEYVDGPPFNYSVDEKKKHAFADAVRRILPQIDDDDLVPDMSGVRPKLQKQGEPVKDFVITHEKEQGLEGFVNLVGIESPGLTASPAIAKLVEKLLFS